MVRVPTDREPTHPGEMLLQEFLLPLSMTQRDPGHRNPRAPFNGSTRSSVGNAGSLPARHYGSLSFSVHLPTSG